MAGVHKQLLTGIGVAWAALHCVVARFLASQDRASLTLNYGGQTWRFPTPHEFEVELTARVGVPAWRMAQFECLGSTKLHATVVDIRRMEVEFAQMLSRAQATGESLRELLATVDVTAFSEDHEWRALFTALANSGSSALDPYRRVALGKYVRYLVSLRSVLQEVRIRRQAAARKRSNLAGADGAGTRLERLTHVQRASRQARNCARRGQWTLPSGTPIGLDLRDPAPFHVELAARTFRIERKNGDWLIVDPNSGTKYLLHIGCNSIGRAQHCDIVVDGRYREISRLHAVINIVDSRTLVMTDLSARGTSVPSTRLMGLSDQ